MASNKGVPVLIVGAGPTGLVLALWLTQLNIPVRIIDQAKGPGETSRALAVHARSLEFYNQIGIVEDLIAQGIQVKTILLRKDGEEIAKACIENFGQGLSPYPYILSLPQDDHEKILTAHLERKGVAVEWNTHLVSFTQDNDQVTATLSTKKHQETIAVDYLCGCDGAHSRTREVLNISFQGGTYQQIFFVADAQSPKPATSDLELAITRKDFCLVLPVRSSGTIRLIGIVPSNCEDPKNIIFDDVRETILRNAGLDIDKANWFSTYHVHHRVAPKFKVGRVFLAGDAAHIHSPAGGQGMNTGIGDAVNLSWKLAAVLQGKNHERLLETYEEERLPFANQLVASTDRLFQMITSTSILGLIWRNFLFPYVFPFILKRSFLSRYLFKFISQIKIKYRQSPLSFSGKGKLQAGDRLPWISYANSDNFYPLKSITWQVHVYGVADRLLREKLEVLNLPLFEFEWGKSAHEAGIIQHAAYLIRPDGYISVIDVNQIDDNIVRVLAEF